MYGVHVPLLLKGENVSEISEWFVLEKFYVSSD
jgi:hypothetical protein